MKEEVGIVEATVPEVDTVEGVPEDATNYKEEGHCTCEFPSNDGGVG